MKIKSSIIPVYPTALLFMSESIETDFSDRQNYANSVRFEWNGLTLTTYWYTLSGKIVSYVCQTRKARHSFFGNLRIIRRTLDKQTKV
jgi:hypothetical protein